MTKTSTQSIIQNIIKIANYFDISSSLFIEKL